MNCLVQMKKNSPELASVAPSKLPSKKLFQKVDPEFVERCRAGVEQLVKALVTNAASLAKSVPFSLQLIMYCSLFMYHSVALLLGQSYQSIKFYFRQKNVHST